MTVTHQINILVNATNAQTSVNNLNNQLTRTTNIVNNINTTNINNFNNQLNNTNTRATQGTFAMKKLAAAMSALGLVYLAKQAYDVVEAFTRITNQIRQTTTSSTELTEVTNRLISISQGSNQSLEGTANLYTRFRLSVDEAKVSSERLLGVVDTISKSLSISGATAAESAGAMRQLSQAVASGVLRGEEFNSISEQAPAILRAVQSATGKTAGELRKLAADGAITTDVLIQSLERYAKKVDKDFKASSTTVGDGLTNLVTGLTVLAGNYDKTTGLTTAFANNLTALGKKLSDPTLLDSLKTVADTVKGSFEQALVYFKKWSALVRLEYDLINAVFTDSTIGQAMDRYNAKLTEMAIKAKEASMIKQSNVRRGGFFEARQPLIDISAPAKVDTDAQEKAARAAEKRAEDARKKQCKTALICTTSLTTRY